MKKSETFRLAQTFLHPGTDVPIEDADYRPCYALCSALVTACAKSGLSETRRLSMSHEVRDMLSVYYRPKLGGGYWWKGFKHATQCQRFMALEFMALIAEEDGD